MSQPILDEIFRNALLMNFGHLAPVSNFQAKKNVAKLIFIVNRIDFSMLLACK